MPNSTASCVALVYDERVYDELCYNPATSSNHSNNNQNTPNETATLYRDRTIQLSDIIYDPD